MSDDQQNKSRWYILGPGAIGSLWASYWQRNNTPVTLIHPRRSGPVPITLVDQGRTISWQAECVRPADIPQPVHQLLITTKAQDTLAAFASIKDALAADAVVLVLQNGLAALALQQQFNSHTLFAGITTDGAYRSTENTVVRAGHGLTSIGCLSTPQLSTSQLLQRLPAEGLAIQYCDDIEQRLWRKWAINCAINALTVSHRCRNGELLSNAQGHAELLALCDEIMAFCRALELGWWFEQLPQHVEQVLKTTSDNYSSMLQDIRNHKSTEIDYLNGYLCNKAKAIAFDCPINTALLQEIRQLQGSGNE